MVQINRLMMAVMVVGGLLMAPAVALADGPGNCNDNSDMYCGAFTKAEFDQKLHEGDGKHSPQDLQQVYFNEGRGISMDDFMSDDTVEGTVTKDGRVIVTGTVVATDAWSTGRNQNPQAHRDGSLWLSPNSAEFLSDNLEAFVNMKDGEFHWAIIKACGNTVVAKPVHFSKPTPTPTPTPRHENHVSYQKPTPSCTPTPPPVQIQKVVVYTTAPTPTPVPMVKAAQTQKPLPAAGPESALAGIGGMGMIGYAAQSYLRSRKSLLEMLRSKGK